MILTIKERELVNFLRKKGLTWEEITYLKWKNFNFRRDKISVPRRFLFLRYNKTVDFNKDQAALHVLKRLEERKGMNHYYVFYKKFPMFRGRRDDERRYGSPFTPEEVKAMARGYDIIDYGGKALAIEIVPNSEGQAIKEALAQ